MADDKRQHGKWPEIIAGWIGLAAATALLFWWLSE
jgi:hypothetical protein